MQEIAPALQRTPLYLLKAMYPVHAPNRQFMATKAI